MVQFPAFCPACGLIFRSRLLSITGNASIILEGNAETCPRCGAMADLPDGTFTVADETISVLSASKLTRERLARLASILTEAQAGALSATAALEAVTDEAPSVRPLVDRFGPTMQRALLIFLATVIQILLAQGVAELRDDAATKADVRRAVEEAIERCQTP